MFEDMEITCIECSRVFTWSAGEQDYYRSRDLKQPKMCKPCREERRRRNKGQIWGARVAMTDVETRRVLCSRCQSLASKTVSQTHGRAVCPRCVGMEHDSPRDDLLTIEEWIRMANHVTPREFR